MGDKLIPLFTGAMLIAIGFVMIRSHRRTWDEQKNDVELPEFDRSHLYKRYRRRMQASSMIILLGLLLGLGGSFPWNNRPRAFGIYWGIVLLLTLWVILQALGDMLSTGAYTKASLSNVREKQRELQRQLEQYKTQRSNGKRENE